MSLGLQTGHFYKNGIDCDYGMIFGADLRKELHKIKSLAVGSFIIKLWCYSLKKIIPTTYVILMVKKAKGPITLHSAAWK